jgi:hypothetical protein
VKIEVMKKRIQELPPLPPRETQLFLEPLVADWISALATARSGEKCSLGLVQKADRQWVPM